MKSLLFCVFAALALQGGATVARACEYCRMAAEDPEAARLAAAMHARTSAFPLDAAIKQFQNVAPSAVLTAPPPEASITTRAADLRTAALPTAVTHRLPPPAVVKTVPVARPAPAPVSHWADGGLLGLLGLAGVFGWRTRRTVRSA